MEENWIQWDDGNCPVVDTSKDVKVKLRDGIIEVHTAGDFRWRNYSGAFDIVAFRFVDDADDNWVDVAAFKSCPVDLSIPVQVEGKSSGAKWSGRAGNFLYWGDKDFKFRIIPKQKEDTDGWIEWHGDKGCPVDAHTKVKVKFRGTNANGSTSESDLISDPENYWWGHDEMPSDIVAYKIVKEQEEPKKPIKETPKTSKPVDLIWGSW